MTGETSLYPEHASPGRPAAGWTGSDLVIGTSLIVLLVTLFMPWFSGTVATQDNSATQVLGSADGPRAHGYVWFVFALAIIGLIVLVARDTIRQVPGNLPSPEQMLLVATGLALLLTILAAVIKPSPAPDLVGQAGPMPGFLSPGTFSVGFSYGGFVAVVAAAIAVAATFAAAGRLKSVRLGRPTMRRRPGASASG